ncbi:MAG: extracellular solute-binding protein [Planctomycetes bacterium]|nr:extracellular solute-binding protein [Planctomycetota bacterium]
MERLAFSAGRGKLATLAVLACAGFGERAQAAPRGDRLVVMAEQQVLESWPLLEEIARRFEAAEPGLEVDLYDEGGAVGGRDKIKFLLAGELQVDVARIDISEFAAFVREGALVDLQPFADADPDFHAGDIWPFALDACRDARGHVYGLPSTFTPYVMYYNRDLLEQAGVPLPRADWTWDDLLAAARKVTRDTDGDGRIDQYGISLTQWLQAVVPWIWQNGGELVSADLQHSRLGEPEAVEAFEFLHRLLHEEHVASFDASFANQISQGLFQAGKAAFYGPVGYWETYRFRSISGFRWDVAPLPQRKTAATSVAMTVYVVPRTSANPARAWRFLREMVGPEYQTRLARMGNGVPALVDIAHSNAFLKPDVPPQSEQVFLDVLPHARLLPPLANWKKIESLCQSELEGILLVRDTDVPAACARMAAKTDEFLARERVRGERPRAPSGVLETSLAASAIALAAFLLLRRGRREGPLARAEARSAGRLLAPWAAGFLLFLLGPAIGSLLLSLCDWSPLAPLADARFVGADNFARLFHDGTFASSVRATLVYAAASVPLSLALALGLALLFSSEGRLAASVRTLIFVPAIVSPVILGALWRWILDPERGAANALLAKFGLEGPRWLLDPHWVVPSFVLVSLWSVGAQMLVFVAALQSVDRTLVEAARIDGAGRWRRLLHVTLPQLSPVILFNAITGTVAAFQVFAQPYVMTQGGPGDASRFLALYVYETGFLHFDMGYASAVAWALCVLLCLALGVLVLSTRRFVHYRAGGGAA